MSRDSRPLYARALRLRHVHPSSLLCFLFFEGMIALGVLLALAELVTWWSVPVLPVAVAGMVKLNDLVAGVLPGGRRPEAGEPAASGPAATGPAASGPAVSGLGDGGLGDGATVPEPAVPPTVTRQVSRDLSDTLDPADSPRQRFRQSARRRYR
ncbi:MAG: hypothetical protein ACRDT2_05530 [Natronosporangium sp.]